jgi:hypothetical protein
MTANDAVRPPLDRVAEIERLAALDAGQYEAERKNAADKLGFRTTILDDLREQKRREMNLDPKGDAGQGRPLQFREFLPWPDDIEGDRIATALSATFKRFVCMSDSKADTCALWVLLDWTIAKFPIATAPVHHVADQTVRKIDAIGIARPC